MTARITPLSAAVRRKRTRPAAVRSHEEIYDLVEACHAECQAANSRSKEAITHSDMMTAVMQRVETKVDASNKSMDELKKTVGRAETDERGKLIGTGLAGDLARLDERVSARFRTYDRWRYIAMGAVAAVAPTGAVIWWLLSDRLAHLLK